MNGLRTWDRISDDEVLANAALIVRSVNSHEALVAALEAARKRIAADLPYDWREQGQYSPTLNQIDAALKQARGT